MEGKGLPIAKAIAGRSGRGAKSCCMIFQARDQLDSSIQIEDNLVPGRPVRGPEHKPRAKVLQQIASDPSRFNHWSHALARLSLGISYRCTSFDKSHLLPEVDDDDLVM